MPACWKDAFTGGATPAPSGSPAPSGAPSEVPAGTVLRITAANVAYDVSSLEVPADTPFAIEFTNNDPGIPHNVAIHGDSPTGPELWQGDIVTGVTTHHLPGGGPAGGHLRLRLHRPPQHDGHPDGQVGAIRPADRSTDGGTMAEQALGAGSVTRRRVLFGLLDAGGWTWASVKAFFWFTTIILLMGYLPDRALYFTIFPTIDLGINVVSPINLCPPSNGDLPCPAPAGSVLAWEPSPSELALPAPRADGAIVQSGVRFLYLGGTDGSATVDTVFETQVRSDGNHSEWTLGAPLPAPRLRPAAIFFAGAVYVIGGQDAAGAPTDTVFVGTPDTATGAITQWTTADALKLPAPRSGATVVLAGDGLFLIGGSDAGGPTTSVWRSKTDTKGALTAWTANAGLPQPRTGASGTLQGTNVFVWGGSDATGPTPVVLLGLIGTGKDDLGTLHQWGVGQGVTNLPIPRAGATGFTANGSLYYVGGTDGAGGGGQLFWAVPGPDGTIPSWNHLPQTDLPAALSWSESVAITSGSHAFLIGGRSADGVTTASARTNLAPKPPYFQLGLFGATIPALGIGGEVGQQLAYLAAAGVATGNFVLLLLIGWAFAHKQRTRELFERYVRRRRHAG